CCGRELIVFKDTPFELPLPQPPGTAQPDGPEGQAPEPTGITSQIPQPAAPAKRAPLPGRLLLLLRYAEEEVELTPALYNEGVCDPSREEPNRVREVAKLEVRHPDEVNSDCWRTLKGGSDAPCRDDCDDEVP